MAYLDHLAIPKVAAVSGRNGSVDALRFAGALGIVAFHLGLPIGAVGHAAVVLFVLLLCYFGAERDAGDRARRLLLPWLAFSALFGGLKLVEVAVAGGDLAAEFHWWMLLTGPALHLWFLPFCFVFLMVMRLLSTNQLWLALLLSILAWNLPVPGAPFGEWALVAPAGILGLLAARTDPVSPLVLTAPVFAILSVAGDGRADLYVIASACLVLAFCVPLPASTALRGAAALSLGIYLVHPALIAVVGRLPLPDPLALATVFAGSVAIAWALYAARLLRG